MRKRIWIVFCAIVMSFGGGCTRDADVQLETEKVTVADKRDEEFTEEWLDKETAELYKDRQSEDFVITQIYSNCFFARPVIYAPYEYKFNGELSEDWCIGDQVAVTYRNRYDDTTNGRFEAEFLKVKVSDFEPEPGAAYKPVIYLYPETVTEVSVKLDLDGELTCTYPTYNEGWKVWANPSGLLKDENGLEYNYLYWEGFLDAEYDFSKGFCVKGEDTAKFLEGALEQLGLNRKEANEFIVYWLPLMQENPYNVISFQTDVYCQAAELEVNPAPDTLIRVFMTYKESEEYVEIEAQELSAPEREGFVVVEWGGAKVR